MIQNQALLFELNISTWTGRKQDKKVSEEVVSQKQAVKDAARVSKDLLAGSKKLKDVQNYTQNVRNWLHTYTQPWSDSGQRLIATKRLLDPASKFKSELDKHEATYNDLVNKFLNDYENDVNTAAFTLGEMFDRSEYPTADKLRKKFKFSWVTVPIPTSNDIRITAAEDAVNELKEQYDKAYQERLEAAMTDAWERLHKTLLKISERVTDEMIGDEIKAKRLHKSTFDNALELTSMLSDFNITNDPKLEQARQDLERTLSNLDMNDLKENADYRKEIKESVDEILSKFDW